MSKILRKTASIFGSTAGVDEIAKFGSLNAASPAFSTDPAVIQSLANWNEGWFAAVEDVNSPAIEDMNAVNYVNSYQVGYIMQAGVAEWDAGTTYYIGSAVNSILSPGVIYISIADNNLNHATTNASFWKILGSDIYLPLAGGTLTGALMGTTGVFSGSLTAASHIVTSGTIPSDGIYLPSADVLGLAANSSLIMSLTASAVNPQVPIAMVPTANQASVFLTNLTSQLTLCGGNTAVSSGGAIALYGASHATKANVTELYNSNAVSGSVSATGAWIVGPIGTQTHTVNGYLNVVNSQAALSSIELDNLSASSSAEAVLSLVVGDAATSSKKAYIQTRNRGSSNANWFFGNLADNNFSIADTTAAGTKRFVVSTAGVTLQGTTTNDNAAAGYVGEYIESVVSTATNYPGNTTVWGNMTSISLTAGDWDVTGVLNMTLNGATLSTSGSSIAISLFSANTTTDHVIGSNVISAIAPASTIDRGGDLASYRISLAAPATVYFKLIATYTVGNPQYTCRLSARRRR